MDSSNDQRFAVTDTTARAVLSTPGRWLTQVTVAVDPEVAYRFVSTPRNWQRYFRITRDLEGEPVDRHATYGDQFVERTQGLAWFLDPIAWIVVADEPPNLWRIRGWRQVGRLWRREIGSITYRCAPVGEQRTEISREMTFEVGAIAPLLMLRARTKREFVTSLNRLRDVLEETG
ncbi:SRPBCC family protein [Mycobacterium sp. E2733]|uniref:SRPBCC family protein n=1 Tax=Mycobacterium sp. E2733 TaxID=1834138 RepID=UPI000A415950|nr:SRPBCC family protein [Mycobacterium sp. E2733]